MKNFGFVAVVTLLLASCGQSKQVGESALEQERDSLQRIINEKDIELNDIMGTFDEVQEGIRRITRQRDVLPLQMLRQRVPAARR